jgi:nucleoside-diphosphate-sugar epimerase
MRVLVTGATGLIRCHATARLVEAGHEVRAFVRDREKLDRVLAPFGTAAQVEAVIGDVTDRSSIERAIEGCEGLLHCAGIFSHRREDSDLLHRINVVGTETAMNAALRSGVDRILYISSALALFPPSGDQQCADDPVARPHTMYARTKAEAECSVRQLQKDGARITTIYPTSVHGPHDPTVGGGPRMIADALRVGGILVTEGGLPYADVRDLADLLACMLVCEDPPLRLMAPAEFVTHESYLEIARRLTGLEIGARRIPGPVLRAMGRAGDLFGRITGCLPELTGEAAEVLTRSVPIDDSLARGFLGRDPIPMEQSFRDLYRWLFIWTSLVII